MFAPFIVRLLGSYVIEIMEDIEDSLHKNLGVMAGFVEQNPAYWNLTKQRVASYWSEYFRKDQDRSDYVGFRIIGQIEDQIEDKMS